MNHCTFTGRMLSSPDLDVTEGTSLLHFKLVVDNYIKTAMRSNKKISTTLTFEAWSTGAETIAAKAKEGTKMTVYCTAKNGLMKTLGQDDILFRVNEFDIHE